MAKSLEEIKYILTTALSEVLKYQKSCAPVSQPNLAEDWEEFPLNKIADDLGEDIGDLDNFTGSRTTALVLVGETHDGN
jgi:hypothetical protein